MPISPEKKRAYDRERYAKADKAKVMAQRKAYYEANKDKAVAYANEYNKKKLAEMREIYDAAKAAPCVDCGVQYPPYVMDLDHLPEFTKHEAVSNMVVNYRSNPRKLREEIAKCELVCANCHRVRTHNRKEAARDAL